MLDVPPKQVSIKAEFVEVSTTDIKRFGIDWSLDRIDQSFATSFLPSGNVVFGFNRGNLTAQVRAQLTNDIGRVINAPIISTINNQPASIAIQTQIPYWTDHFHCRWHQRHSAGNAAVYLGQHSIEVLPRVNGDGTITMQLMPQVSDSGNIINGPNGESLPEIKTQQLQTQRRVANGETIVVGGFIRKNDSNSYMRVPIPRGFADYRQPVPHTRAQYRCGRTADLHHADHHTIVRLGHCWQHSVDAVESYG